MTRRRRTRKEKAKVIFGTVVLTVFAVILIANLWPGEVPARHEVEAFYDAFDPEFRRTASHLLSAPLIEGNLVEPLLNGKSLDAMIEALEAAERTVTFETYIFWSGQVADRFIESFDRAVARGVKVHVLLDWFGSSRLEASDLARMEDAGISLHRYHRPVWHDLDKLNNRTHRKVLVVDGRVGFIGGVGIADHWQGNARTPEEWRDTHFRIEGPVVAQLQSVFLDNWHKVSADVLHGPDYFPPLVKRGDSLAQVMKSTAEHGGESVRLAYIVSIAAARKRILIANAYFVPDSSTLEALLDARARGVSIEVIVPGEITDTPVLRLASRSGWKPLLSAGIELYEYQPTMYHPKVMVVDGVWTLVGSSNFDGRSFSYNDEANLNVWDPEFAAEQTSIFEEDKKASRRITFDDWRRRSLREKLTGYLTSFINPQL